VKRVRFVVTGRVQGVGFRWFVKAEAVPLELTGWIRNRSDGAVEGEVEGREDAIDALEAVRNELRAAEILAEERRIAAAAELRERAWS